MAQTKRKRRNKHRGNAVGSVEARGRTSKPRPGDKPARGARAKGPTGRYGRPLKPPSWQSAATKAIFGGVVLFMFARFGLLGSKSSTQSALVLAVAALVFYTPIMFITDKWIYQRKMRQMESGPPAKR
jgi:hypothetical protein